jgi:hypothetical protein
MSGVKRRRRSPSSELAGDRSVDAPPQFQGIGEGGYIRDTSVMERAIFPME